MATFTSFCTFRMPLGWLEEEDNIDLLRSHPEITKYQGF